MTAQEELDLNLRNARAAYLREEITYAELMQLCRIWAAPAELDAR